MIYRKERTLHNEISLLLTSTYNTYHNPAGRKENNVYQQYSNYVHQLYNNISLSSSQNEKCFRKTL
jgi:hypothetical protein